VTSERTGDGDRETAALALATDGGSDRFVAAVAVDGEVLFAGPSVPAVLGVERETLLGANLLNYVHPNDRERVTERFYRALADPEAAPTMEYRYRTADGDWVRLESRTRSLPDDVAVGRSRAVAFISPDYQSES